VPSSNTKHNTVLVLKYHFLFLEPSRKTGFGFESEEKSAIAFVGLAGFLNLVLPQESQSAKFFLWTTALMGAPLYKKQKAARCGPDKPWETSQKLELLSDPQRAALM
jgi:hypothetical protein